MISEKTADELLKVLPINPKSAKDLKEIWIDKGLCELSIISKIELLSMKIHHAAHTFEGDIDLTKEGIELADLYVSRIHREEAAAKRNGGTI